MQKKAPVFSNGLSISSQSGLIQQGSKSARQFMSTNVYANYQKTYSAVSNLSEYMDKFVSHFLAHSSAVEDDFIMEIGSNDGSVLNHLKNLGFNVFGVDPSAEAKSSDKLKAFRTFF